MSKLVVAEKPSVAQTIAKVLGAEKKGNGYISGNGYIVSWCSGHLVGLAYPESYDENLKKWSFDNLPIIPDKWKFTVSASTKKQYDILKSLMNSNEVSEVICATDAGREGECIFRYVYNMARCKKPMKRLWVSSLEESAIADGFKNLKSSTEYDNLFAAGLSRAKADWCVGLNATRLFTVRYNNKLTIGRVQTPTLAMVVERDFKVKNFIKEKYYTVELLCSNEHGSFTFVSVDKYETEEKASEITAACNGKHANIITVSLAGKTINPPKLYDLTTLQREANRQFGYTAQQTLDYTQSLYEQKLCTYPRTDSQYITEDMAQSAASLVTLSFEHFPYAEGISFTPDVSRICNSSKVSDHTGLLPTVEIANKDISALPDGERNILYLIITKLICATAQPHKYHVHEVVIDCANYKFSATGKTIKENGWKEYEATIKAHFKGGEAEEKDNTVSLAKIAEHYAEYDIVADKVTAQSKEHWTSPPKPFTEDTLLSAMEHAGQENYDEEAEKKGLGTPATRAGIIEGLVKNEYIVRNKKQLIATEKGIELIKVVPDEVKSPLMTAEWETMLQKIEKGAASDTEFLDGINNFVRKLCEDYSSSAENAAFKRSDEPIGKCPKCGGEVKKGKYGFYCTNKCGMNVATVYGKVLTETQLKKLLNGEKISYTANDKKTIVKPSFRENVWQGKTTYVWVTEKG